MSVFGALVRNRGLLLMYGHLLVSALAPIYAGAYASLSCPSSAAKPQKNGKSNAGDEDNDDEDNEEEDADKETDHRMEGLTTTDAIIFPLTAALVLTGLYFAIKRYGADLINLILGVYFALIGIYSVSRLIADCWSTVENFISPTWYSSSDGTIWKINHSQRKAVAMHKESNSEKLVRTSPLAKGIPLPGPLRGFAWAVRDMTRQKYVVTAFAKHLFDSQANLTLHKVICTVLSIAVVTYSTAIDSRWWLINLQGFAVSYGALQLMSPTSFATGSLILSGLFFYDIWAVFYTPLMVTVAKSLNVPIKLVFPRPEESDPSSGKPPTQSYSMLGLGDIVLPGLMIALALRFDLYMYYLRKQQQPVRESPVSSKDSKQVESVTKAPYALATGHWGDKFWTAGVSQRSKSQRLPAYLTTAIPKPYFAAAMIGYTIGMIATLIFMNIFQHAQPALLYLVPAVLLSLWGTGLARGELKYLIDYSESFDIEPADGQNHESENVTQNTDEAAAGSFIAELWNSVFGAKPSDRQDGPNAATKSITEQPKVAADSDFDTNTLFSFSIKVRARKTRQADAATSEKTADKQTAE